MRSQGRATITDVARHAGVSRSTVSLVLADNPRIPDRTKQRVRESMADLGYVYNRAASVIRGGQSSLLALILTNIRNPFFAEVTMAVDRAVLKRDMSVVQGFSFGDPEREARIARSLAEHQIAGLIMLPTAQTPTVTLAGIRAGGAPVVALLRPVDGLECDFVGVDNLASGRRLGTHLRDIGAQDVLLVTGLRTSAQLAARHEGIIEGLGAAGRHVEVVHEGADGLHRVLGSGARPDCVVTYNDTYVLETMRVLREFGLQPGRDIAMASFDNTPLSEQVFPGLTAIDHHAGRLAETAVDLVFQRIGEPGRGVQRVLIPPTLVVRESTGFLLPPAGG